MRATKQPPAPASPPVKPPRVPLTWVPDSSKYWVLLCNRSRVKVHVEPKAAPHEKTGEWGWFFPLAWVADLNATHPLDPVRAEP